MTPIKAKLFLRSLLATTLLSLSGLAASARTDNMYRTTAIEHAPLPLAKLCMPVTYRQNPPSEAVKIKIAMLGDRYHEVLEALSGWNESGFPLTGKIAGQWEPVPCGDDTGLFYIVPLIARTTGLSADLSLDFFLLGFIAVSAVVGLIGFCLGATRAWQRWLCIAPLLAGSLLSYKMGDVYVIQPSLVLMLIPWLIYVLSPTPSSIRRYVIIFLIGVLLGVGQWIRTQSATALIIFFVVLLIAGSMRSTVKLLAVCALIAGASLPLLYARLPIHQRDTFLASQQHDYRPPLNRHLLWHTAYVGLAFLSNTYVSAWQDEVAVDYVETVDPTAIYASEEYETVLRLRVWQIARHDLRFIFYTLAAKAGVLACIFLLSANIGLAATIFRPKPLAFEVAFWSAMAFAAAPGMIAVPAPQYILGMITLAFYYWYYSILFYVENGASTFPLPKTPARKGSTADHFSFSRS